MNDSSASNSPALTSASNPDSSRSIRPGWQTTEFWLTLLGHLGLISGAISGVLPPQYAALAAAASQVAYNLSRGLVKSSAAAPAAS